MPPKEPRRPARLLIALIDKLPVELVEEISPAQLKLKSNLKVPLVLLCWSSGLMNGCGLVFLKVCGEIVNSDELMDNFFFALLVGLLGGACAVLQVYMLNQSMRLYNNLDVMPIYQALILMHLMASGMIILDEAKFYSWSEMLLLWLSALIVILGIYILTQKKNLVVISEQDLHNAVGQDKTSFVFDQTDLNIEQLRVSRSSNSFGGISATRPQISAHLVEELLPQEDDEGVNEQTVVFYTGLIRDVFDEDAFPAEEETTKEENILATDD